MHSYCIYCRKECKNIKCIYILLHLKIYIASCFYEGLQQWCFIIIVFYDQVRYWGFPSLVIARRGGVKTVKVNRFSVTKFCNKVSQNIFNKTRLKFEGCDNQFFQFQKMEFEYWKLGKMKNLKSLLFNWCLQKLNFNFVYL